jgi:DNA-binding transcriptional LysR family regulator
VDIAFVRLPIDRDSLSVVRLYGEIPVIVLPRDHELAARDALTEAEATVIAGVVAFPPSGSVKDAVALVAAGVGALRLPHSLARLHARKEVVAVPISDGEETDIAVVWVADTLSPAIEEFVGIVRGRTSASSRGAAASTQPAKKAQPAKKKEQAARSAASTARKPHRVTGNRAQARNRKNRGR